jgi:hypothetical protein
VQHECRSSWSDGLLQAGGMECFVKVGTAVSSHPAKHLPKCFYHELGNISHSNRQGSLLATWCGLCTSARGCF